MTAAAGRRAGFAAWLLAAGALAAQTGNTHILIVGGLGGEPDYERRFATYVSDLEQIGGKLAGDASRVVSLSGKGATREAIQSALEKLARTATAADSLAVFLIGHGSFDGAAYKFNIPGPDLTHEEIGRASCRERV